MAKIEAVFFDFDGVLRDSREAIWAATEQALIDHDVTEITREQIRPHVHHLDSVRNNLAQHATKLQFENSYMAKIDTLRHTMELYEFVPVLIKHLHERGYKLGLVTSSTSYMHLLEEHNLMQLFDAAVGGNHVTNHKPHPEPVEKALTELKLAPAEAIMVGDLAADIMAAKAAGLRATIGITHGFGTREMLEAAKADYIIDSLEDLLLLIEKIEKNHGS